MRLLRQRVFMCLCVCVFVCVCACMGVCVCAFESAGACGTHVRRSVDMSGKRELITFV